VLLLQVEVLRMESLMKDADLSKGATAHKAGRSQRDLLRQDMNTLLADYRQKQSVVELQIQEIDKLNLVINNLEKDMVRLKSEYEHAVDDRNKVGVQLINLNDELCIIHEQYSRQKDQLTVGERGLQSKEEELRILRLQSEELKRQYHAAAKKQPDVSESRSQLKRLEDELKSLREESEDLSGQLEDPKNIDRWRALDGEDPDMEQLTAKILILEKSVNDKREQLLQKGLVLEEVTELTTNLKRQAMGRRDNAKSMADQLNGLQVRIRDTTKKMLATVSELSMYQVNIIQ
jgi:chromosome segregation ATPase